MIVFCQSTNNPLIFNSVAKLNAQYPAAEWASIDYNPKVESDGEGKSFYSPGPGFFTAIDNNQFRTGDLSDSEPEQWLYTLILATNEHLYFPIKSVDISIDGTHIKNLGVKNSKFFAELIGKSIATQCSQMLKRQIWIAGVTLFSRANKHDFDLQVIPDFGSKNKVHSTLLASLLASLVLTKSKSDVIKTNLFELF